MHRRPVGTSWRRRLVFAAIALAAIAVAAWRLEAHVEDAAAAALHRRGASARHIDLSWLGALRFTGLSRPMPGGAQLTIETLDVRWRLLGGRDPRSHVSGLSFRHLRLERPPLGFTWPAADLAIADWSRDALRERVVLRHRSSDGGLELIRDAGRIEIRLDGFDLWAAEVQWSGETVVRPGVWSGRVALATGGGGRRQLDAALDAAVLHLSAPTAIQPATAGLPTALTLNGRAEISDEAVAIQRLEARVHGLEVSAKGEVRRDGRSVDVHIEARSALGDLFRTVGLAVPLPRLRTTDLGVASLDLQARGPLGAPADLVVRPQLRFEPAPPVVEALSYLRGPFSHRPDASPGLVVDVREGTPDFIAIDELPPLFERALLLSEDAGFLQHAGIDIAEIVAAWAEREENGRVRGASTITQQLVKNLFLSDERTYGRKLNEAALAVMVDAVIPKRRLLEIYVNIIEWGPRLHGLRPAARHYFAKEPGALTAKEAAFLVCVIPSPVRYHQAHTAGRLGPGMEQLVQNLLAKLRALDHLDEETYQAALDEELVFAPES